jgi:hypothetical protein
MRLHSRLRLLRMTTPIRVTIVGAPIACGGELKDTYRQLSRWIAEQLRLRYRDAVQLDYRDLLDPDCPAIPHGAQLPLVLVDGAMLSSGGKLSAPRIRQAVEDLGVRPVFPERGRAQAAERLPATRDLVHMDTSSVALQVSGVRRSPSLVAKPSHVA